MQLDREEEKLLRSVALQNARAVLTARERAERDTIAAKEALEKSHQQLTRTLDSISDGFFALDSEWRFTYVNLRGREVLNRLRHSEFLGKVIWTEFPELAGSDIEKNYRLAAREQVTVEFETYFQPLNSWYAVRAYPSQDGLSIYFLDISKRKISDTQRADAGEALRDSEQRFRAVFNQAAVGMAIARLDGTFEQVNDRFAEILGYSSGELNGKNFSEITHPEDLPSTHENVRRLLASQSNSYLHEKRYIRRDGSAVWSQTTVNLLKDQDGKPERFVGTIEDISHRKETEELRSRLAAVVESSDDAIISMDLETHILTWNKGAELVFGYTAAEIVGKPVNILLPEGRKDEEPKILEHLFRGERVEHYETVRVRKDGTLLDVSLTVSPIYDAAGRLIGVSKISRDITARKEAEEKLRAAREDLHHHAINLETQVAERTARLRETIGELEAFSYSVSHDLRSPLRAMQGYSDALLDDYSSNFDETGRDYLNRIKRAALRMDLLIQDVLAYSRVAQGDVLLGPVDVEAIIRDLIQNYSALRPEAAQITIHGPLPRVIGHEAYLTQIVSNFLTNAVKFIAPGTFPTIDIGAEPQEEYVRLYFKDNGIGIAPEHLDRVFQIFGRVYSEKQYEGTGIGLAIVKKAAHRLGGSVGVTSEPGKGSCFFVLLKPAS